MSSFCLNPGYTKASAGYVPVLLLAVFVRRLRRWMRLRTARRLPVLSEHMMQDIGISGPRANRRTPRDHD